MNKVKAFNRITRQYLFRKINHYWTNPVIDGILDNVVFFTGEYPQKLFYPKGERKFRNVLPGLFARLMKVERSSGYLGKYSIHKWFAKEFLHLEPEMVQEKTLEEIKKLITWNMYV